MAEKKVSELTEASNVGDNDLLLVVQDGVSKKVKKSNGGFGVSYTAGNYINIDANNKISGNFKKIVSSNSNNDVGTSTTKRLSFNTCKPGKYIYKNKSSSSTFYYSYNHGSSSSTMSTTTGSTSANMSVGNYSSNSFYNATIEMLYDLDDITTVNALPQFTILGYITFEYNNNEGNNQSNAYTKCLYKGNSSTTDCTINITDRSAVLSKDNLSSLAQNASAGASASSTANQALQATQSLDTRVTALEQGGGSGGGDLHLLKPFGNCSSFYIPSSGTGYNTFTGISGNPDVAMNINTYNNTIVFAPTSSATSDFTIKNAMLEVTNTRTHEVAKINLGDIYVSYYNPVSISANVLSGLSSYDSYNATLNEGTATGLVASKVLQFDLYDFTSHMGTFTLNRDSDSDFWTTMDNLFKSVTSLDYTGLLNITSSIYDTTTPTVTIMQGILCGVETSMNYVALRFASYYYNQSSHQPTLMSYTVALNWNSTNNRVGNITINM